MSIIKSFRDINVYLIAFKLLMNNFNMTKSFPNEEKHSLMGQIKSSSRTVCANLAEAWAKKRNFKLIINKISNSHREEYETEVWLDYCKEGKYMNGSAYCYFIEEYNEVRRILLSLKYQLRKFYN